MRILCALRNVNSFPGVYPSDLIPHSVTRFGCLILNTDPHNQEGSHWLAIHLTPRSYSGYYFDSYGLTPDIPQFLSFLRRNCTVWDYNRTQLQGLTSTVCGKYCCLFALYTDRGFTPKQFVALFDAGVGRADSQVNTMFAAEFGSLRNTKCGGQCCTDFYKSLVFRLVLFIVHLHSHHEGSCYRLRNADR